MDFSDYIVYVDESGDHNLTHINSKYPVFVLAFCIFHKKYYNAQIVKEIQKLKFDYFGHDMIVLHERDILKRNGVFNISNELHQALINDISQLIQQSKFIVIACVIQKDKLKDRYQNPSNPYHLAMNFGLERLYNFLSEKHQQHKRTFVVFEQRGANEDKNLKLEFERVCQGNNIHKHPYPFEIILASKQVNSSGMQLADLIARPIGSHVLHPQQHNRAFEIIKDKFYCKYGRQHTGCDYEGFGLKIFP